ncbi:MAG: glycoside hydrolase family 31 protein [Muribaculaceae bacterium]|nr:glycoside hydrolase family 31 protein [Muribaculaceae bacterium]
MKLKSVMGCMLALTALSAVAAEKVSVKFYTPEIVRIVKYPEGKPAAERESLVVTAKPEDVKVTGVIDYDATCYDSSALRVLVDNNSGKVSFFKPDGELIVAEGKYGFTPITEGIDKGSYKVMQSFALEVDEPIYGVGMLQNGKMSQRGEHRLMQQSNLEDFAHFFQSIKGYGIFWDNYSPTTLNDNETLELESQVGDLVDYYFMYGGDADGVIADIRWLTGSVPMVPLWTYGFHQSRERYKTQDELLEVVDKYRKLGIPFDGIIQDWQYWGSNYTWNAMEFINPDFNRAQEMIDKVHDNNAHISISIWQSFGPQTKQYKELKDKGLLFDFETWPESGLTEWPPRRDYLSGVRVYDAYSPEARDIYWNHLKRLHSMGIDAWWMDSTDPDHMQYKDSDLDQPSALGSYRSVRNLFPFMCVGGVDTHQRADDNQKRPFILTRSYFTGQQRFGSQSWSGDVGSSWDSFRKQVPLVLNHTLTGNPNVNTDIGGFFSGSYNRNWDPTSGSKNPQFQELYTRWMQFGAFTPMMRSHGADTYREIYYFGKEGEPVYDALVDAIKLRYRLMPYIYSTARRVSANDDSFMRALFMDFKDDKNTWDNGREFMFGRSILVCPVLDPLYTEEKIVKTDEMSGWDKQDANLNAEGWQVVDWTAKKVYDVYLPAGSDWYDFWTNKKYDGGQTVKADAPLSYSPLYVKAGSIIPLAEDMQYTSEKPWDYLTLNVYPGADAEFVLYEDEGDGFGYQEGKFTKIPMSWNDKKHTLTIDATKGSFDGMLKNRTFKVVLPDGRTKEIAYSGKRTSLSFK